MRHCWQFWRNGTPAKSYLQRIANLQNAPVTMVIRTIHAIRPPVESAATDLAFLETRGRSSVAAILHDRGAGQGHGQFTNYNRTGSKGTCGDRAHGGVSFVASASHG